MCVCVCACVRACVRVRACVGAWVRVCVSRAPEGELDGDDGDAVDEQPRRRQLQPCPSGSQSARPAGAA